MGNVISVQPNTHFAIRAKGNLEITTHDRQELMAGTSPYTFRFEQTAPDRLEVYLETDALLHLPVDAIVHIERVNGNFTAKNWPGDLSVERVDGNLNVMGANLLKVIKVAGNMNVSDIRSALSFAKVGGEVLAQRVHAVMESGKLGGDLHAEIELLQGEIRAGGDVIMTASAVGDKARLDAGGNVQLTTPMLGKDVMLEAGGNVGLVVTQTTGFKLDAQCGSGEIDIHLAGQHLQIRSHHYSNTFNDSNNSLAIRAGGRVRITDEALAGGEVEMNFEHLSEQMEGINRMVEINVSAAVRRAEELAANAEQMAANIEREVRIRFEREHGEPVQPVSDANTSAAAPVANDNVESSSVSDEERLTILRMLQEKKITPEEAERLLEVLENR